MAKRWKQQERRVARALNARRNTHIGVPAPDAENQWLAIEVKDRQELPQWLVTALAKARGWAGKHRLGLVVVTSSSTRQALVVLDLSDFQDWFVGTPKKEPLRETV